MSDLSDIKKQLSQLNPYGLRQAREVCEKKIEECKEYKRGIADLLHHEDQKFVKEIKKFINNKNKVQKQWEDLLKKIAKLQ